MLKDIFNVVFHFTVFTLVMFFACFWGGEVDWAKFVGFEVFFAPIFTIISVKIACDMKKE